MNMAQNLSICVNVKDRSRDKCSGRSLTLFPNCVSSLVYSIRESQVAFGIIQLSVADWGSVDWPLTEWLESFAAGEMEVAIITPDGAFSRGRGRNLAAEAARYNNLFFLDADMIVVPEVIRDGMECLAKNVAYFPEPWGYRDQDNTSTYRMDRGTGNCFVTRDQWMTAGKFPERTTWGHEDTDFHEMIGRHYEIHRPPVPRFLHQWHPNGWRWRHGTDPESDQYQTAARRVARI